MGTLTHSAVLCSVQTQLLLNYLSLAAATAAEAGGSRRTLALQHLQALLLPYLGQQLLVVLCWGPGQAYSCCQVLLQEEEEEDQQQH